MPSKTEELWSDKPRYRFSLYALNSNSIGNYEPFIEFGEGYTNRASIFVFAYMLIVWLYYSIYGSINYLALFTIGILWFVFPDLILAVYFYYTQLRIVSNCLVIKFPFRKSIEIHFDRIREVIIVTESKSEKSLLLRYIDDNRQTKNIKLFNILKYEQAADIFKENGLLVKIKK